jgi:hypothetical protein
MKIRLASVIWICMYLTMSRQRLAGETFPPFGISGREGTKEGVDASGPNETASIQLGFLFPAWIFISVGNKTFVPKCKNTNGGRIVHNATWKGKSAPQTFRERILRAARSEKSSS